MTEFGLLWTTDGTIAIKIIIIIKNITREKESYERERRERHTRGSDDIALGLPKTDLGVLDGDVVRARRCRVC